MAARPDRLAEAEAWIWAVLRIVFALFGMWLIFTQTRAPNPPGAQLWILIVGGCCMGPAVSAPLAAMVAAMRGAGPPEDQA